MTPKKSCGCAGSAPSPRDEGPEVVWHDPTKYDPARHGPPYMPVRLAGEVRATVRRIASSHVSPKVARRLLDRVHPLGTVLGVLRAASFLHQTHHWQTSGPSYYADHLLFDRLYKDSQPYIDQVAEKAVGLGHVNLVHPIKQANQVALFVRIIANAEPSDFVRASLRIEALVLQVLDEAIAVLRASDALTQGMSNLLQGVADLHETFVYLLQQREPSAYDYAR